MNSNTSGNLQLKIVSGKLTRDVETFGKMDPYVICLYLGQKFKTTIHEDGGKTPVWNHTFEIKIGSVQDDMQFYVKDNDVIGAKEIGSAIIKASSLCINNGVRDWFTFYYEGKDVGQIMMESKFTPAAGSASSGIVHVQPAGVTIVPGQQVLP